MGPMIMFRDTASSNPTGSAAVLTGKFDSGFSRDLNLVAWGGLAPLADGSRMLAYFLVGNQAELVIPLGGGNSAGSAPTDHSAVMTRLESATHP